MHRLLILCLLASGCPETGGMDGGTDTSERDTFVDDTMDTGVEDTDVVDTFPDTVSDSAMDVPDTNVPDTRPDTMSPSLTCPAVGFDSPEPIVAYDFTSGVSDVADRAPPINLAIEGTVEVSDGAAHFVGGRLIASARATQILTEAMSAGSFSVEVWAAADDLVSEDIPPERILTFSQDSVTRLLTIGNNTTSLVIRLRSSLTDRNATDCTADGTNAAMMFEDVFDASGTMKHIVIVFDAVAGRPRVYVGGTERTAAYCGVARASLRTWDEGHRLVLGNEFNSPRAFEGRIGRVAIYDRALTASEVTCWYEAGESAPIEP